MITDGPDRFGAARTAILVALLLGAAIGIGLADVRGAVASQRGAVSGTPPATVFVGEDLNVAALGLLAVVLLGRRRR